VYLSPFKNFSLLYTIINFLFTSLKLLKHFENAFCNPPQNFLPGVWSVFSSSDLSLAAGKMSKNSLVIGSFRNDFVDLQAASCMLFHRQNHRFRDFEAGD
jgi:hypothetical protein